MTFADIQSAFVQASYGKLAPSLMKYSVATAGDRLMARIVVLESIDDEESDRVFDILGDMVGHLDCAADFELIKVATLQEAYDTLALPNLLFWAYRLDAEL
jgi:hypothetical protein